MSQDRQSLTSFKFEEMDKADNGKMFHDNGQKRYVVADYYSGVPIYRSPMYYELAPAVYTQMVSFPSSLILVVDEAGKMKLPEPKEVAEVLERFSKKSWIGDF